MTEAAAGGLAGEARSASGGAGGQAAGRQHAVAVRSIQRRGEASFSLAQCALIALWIAVEATLLAGALWAAGRPLPGAPQDERAAAVAVCLASVPATMVLSLVWLLCGPRDRQGQWTAAAMALFALTVWIAVDQIAAAAPRQRWELFFQPAWQIAVAATPGPLLLVWWLWGVAAVVFFYRYFARRQITRDAVAAEGVPLRLSRLLAVTLLVSITASGSRYWASMLPIELPEVLLATACVFGFGICSGMGFLSLTIGMMQSPWWGYSGLLAVLLVTMGYAASLRVAFERTVTTEWVAVLLVSLAAGLFHYAIFLLPLRAAGYRLRGGS